MSKEEEEMCWSTQKGRLVSLSQDGLWATGGDNPYFRKEFVLGNCGLCIGESLSWVIEFVCFCFPFFLVGFLSLKKNVKGRK